MYSFFVSSPLADRTFPTPLPYMWFFVLHTYTHTRFACLAYILPPVTTCVLPRTYRLHSTLLPTTYLVRTDISLCLPAFLLCLHTPSTAPALCHFLYLPAYYHTAFSCPSAALVCGSGVAYCYLTPTTATTLYGKTPPFARCCKTNAHATYRAAPAARRRGGLLPAPFHH